MAKEQKSFVKGRMNKSVDERLLPEGEYVDALNIRLGSTELSEIGAVENSKGNVQLTELKYNGVALSNDAVCIGAFDDSAEETMYWFVHDPNHSYGGVVDMIVSFNVSNNQLVYHVVTTALLNFNPTYLVNAVDKIDDLLFFTDDYNPPRKINVTRGYPQPDPITNLDQIIELDISVIKPQPMEAPVIELQNSSEDSNHIRDTFISFAYRYKYKDGEYSALSQFSDIAFTPDVFYISDSNMVNDGMENQYNSVKVSFNTGAENVIGVDVVYKESDSNFIYVAKKIDKELLSLANNFTESVTFSNNEIYTILSEPELLRLYDNVPRLAKAQTIMGNRVMYGNYLEGRDIVDDTGSKVDFNYETSLFSRVGILDSIEYDEQDTTSFTYNLTGTPLTKQSSSLIIETSGKPVDYYSSEVTLNITMVFESLGLFFGNGNPISYTNFTPVNTSQGDRFIVNFNYTPNQDYQSAYQAYNTNEFKDKTGENGYEQLPSDWEIDSTLTGRFNFLSSKPFSYATNLYPDFTTLRSARDSSSLSDFIKFEVLPNGDIHLVPNALQFEHPDASNPDTTDYYVFYKIKRVSVSWSREIGQRSLHSNRDYQIGILYEDSEGRYSPVFESNINSVFIPSSKSDDINSIKVTIPSSMKAPSWASRYKFLAKQNKTDYETIFSTKSYIDEDTGRYWILLDGEQSNKVSVGQELIVKKDGAGPTVNEVITTVLDVKSLATGDLYNAIAGNFSPSGVYASMSPDGWNIEQGNLTTFTRGQYTTGQSTDGFNYLATGYPADVIYPVHNNNGDSWRIESGDVVNISFSFVRRGDGNACGDEICFFNERYISSGEYADLRDFWIQQPVDLSLVDCSETNDISGANQTTFDANEITLTNILPTNTNIDGVNQLVFGRDGNNRLYLVLISGSKNCGRRSIIKCKIEIVRNSGLLVFETNPTATNNAIYFENEQSFPIVNGYHTSGDLFDDQDQSAVQDGIVNLSFFNCFTFLNGVESYKFKDSLLGKKFYLGQRVTSVSDEDYREIRREASITYSGVYNEQTNINRTNEFNLGLANYKDCEISYGPIQVLHGRSTDLLTLQEDRISYISLGKNLLVAADGAGVLTSVPEVLGTQVARIEEYGISSNPESFTHYGADIYFTDAKRSAVIQLKGGSKAESLSVISNIGMRSWFRDLFQTSFSYQKLGGYDPYMDEYVLSPNTNGLPSEPILYDCGGLSRTFNGILTTQEIEVNAGLLYGNVTVFVQATNEVSVTVTYNGVTTTPVTGTGSLNVYFDKDVPTVTTFTVTITPIDANPLSVTELFTGCPVADTINVVPVVLTSGVNQGDSVTNAFGYTDATVSPTYTSPFQSNQIQFLSPSQMQYVTQNIVSQYGPTYTAQQGSGSVPIDGSTGIIVSSKTVLDTFVFDDSVQSFRYLRTNNPSLYPNTEAGINQLLADSLPATTSGSAPIYSGLYTMPSGADGDYLFLIWDYRQNKQLKMCYSNTSDVNESCCECFSSPSCIPFLGTTVELTDGAACALSPTTTYYTSSLVISGVPNTQPILGTTVYSYLGCNSGNTVGAGFIKLADNTWVETDSNGEVIAVGNC